MTPRTISCVIVVALGAGLAAQTADRDRAEAETRRVDDRMRALQNEADGLAGQARTLLDDLRQLEIDREIQNERVGQAQAAVAQGQAAVASTTERLAALERERIAQLPELQAQLVDIYKSGQADYARLLLGGSGAQQLGRATRAVSALMHLNWQRIAEHRRTLDAVQLEHERLDAEFPALQASEAAARRA